ncbi:MAG: ATP-dependent sacrificial sulfur transferase LarE [Planctomycetes bacterium]|nr:ATP-dependent sacrificial sulfur transferase LarE [Planctomycetota bacterium]
MDEAEAREAQLRTRIRRAPRALVAYSAGVDSTYLLAVAHQELGGRLVAVTADSPSLARASLAEARAFCAAQGIEHRVVATHEFDKPEYVANDGQRCYHCKADLLEVMRAMPSEPGTELFVGAIADDLADWRPGMKAAGERGAAFPLAEVGMTKAMIRERSRALGLATWDRPAEPCLSSRVPYGEPVTPEAVRMIEAAERHLRGLGLRTCRARHHAVGGGKAWLCRIEVPVADLEAVLRQREAVVAGVLAAGYAHAALDLAGFRSGGYNDMLKAGD